MLDQKFIIKNMDMVKCLNLDNDKALVDFENFLQKNIFKIF